MDKETDQQKSANFYKLISLLVDIGAEALRDALLKEIPQNQMAAFIQQNYTLLFKLKRLKVLTEPQFDLLQEPQPDPWKFDISLLVALLRNICPNIEAPTPDWKVGVPAATDNSIGAEILRIRNIRNSNLHISSTMMPKAIFKPLWDELVGIIVRISTKVNKVATIKVVGKIGDLKHRAIHPPGEKEKLLKQFEDWQTQIIDIMSEKINSLQRSLESLHIQNGSMLDVVDAVRQTSDEKLSSFQKQLVQLTQDVSMMSVPQAAGNRNYSETRHADFEELKQHLQILQRDVISIKQHILQVYSAQTTSSTSRQMPVVNKGGDEELNILRGNATLGSVSLQSSFTSAPSTLSVMANANSENSEDLFGEDDCLYDGLTEPEILAMLDDKDFLAIQQPKASQELDNRNTNRYSENGQASIQGQMCTTIKYSPSDIERKKQQARKRREKKLIDKQLNSSTPGQGQSSSQDQLCTPTKYSPLDIERKKQEALKRKAAKKLDFKNVGNANKAFCQATQQPNASQELDNRNANRYSEENGQASIQGQMCSTIKYSPSDIERKKQQARKRREKKLIDKQLNSRSVIKSRSVMYADKIFSIRYRKKKAGSIKKKGGQKTRFQKCWKCGQGFLSR